MPNKSRLSTHQSARKTNVWTLKYFVPCHGTVMVDRFDRLPCDSRQSYIIQAVIQHPGSHTPCDHPVKNISVTLLTVTHNRIELHHAYHTSSML